MKGFKYYDWKPAWMFFKNHLNKANFLIAVSESDHDILTKEFPDNHTVFIPNGVDLSLYGGSAKVEKKITYIGRIHSQKGLDYLFRAFCEYITLPQWRLEIIGGENEYSKKLKEMYKSKRIIWRGYVSDRKKIAQMLSSSYAICLPSLWEGSPLTLFEALASGRPVVATDIGAFSSVLTDKKNGMLCRTENEVDIAEALAFLIKDKSYAKTMGKRGQEIAKRHDWKEIAKLTGMVYDYLIEIHDEEATEVAWRDS